MPSSRGLCFSIPPFPSRLFSLTLFQGLLTLSQGAFRLKTPHCCWALLHSRAPEAPADEMPLKSHRCCWSWCGSRALPRDAVLWPFPTPGFPLGSPRSGGLLGSWCSPNCSKSRSASVQGVNYWYAEHVQLTAVLHYEVD